MEDCSYDTTELITMRNIHCDSRARSRSSEMNFFNTGTYTDPNDYLN